MGIADLNEIMQSGKKRRTTDTLERARDKDPYPQASLMTNRLDDIKSHIRALESKLDHTKQLIRNANQMTQDFQERHSNVPMQLSKSKKEKRSMDARLKIQLPGRTIDEV